LAGHGGLHRLDGGKFGARALAQATRFRRATEGPRQPGGRPLTPAAMRVVPSVGRDIKVARPMASTIFMKSLQLDRRAGSIGIPPLPAAGLGLGGYHRPRRSRRRPWPAASWVSRSGDAPGLHLRVRRLMISPPRSTQDYAACQPARAWGVCGNYPIGKRRALKRLVGRRPILPILPIGESVIGSQGGGLGPEVPPQSEGGLLISTPLRRAKQHRCCRAR
jgi:hypothetical protein